MLFTQQPLTNLNPKVHVGAFCKTDKKHIPKNNYSFCDTNKGTLKNNIDMYAYVNTSVKRWYVSVCKHGVYH